MTLCDKFATDDGEHLPQTVTKNNVLLACGICVRNYKGNSIYFHFILFKFYSLSINKAHCAGPSLYTIRASKLYINHYLDFAQYLHSW